jgi:hypothetical protein
LLQLSLHYHFLLTLLMCSTAEEAAAQHEEDELEIQQGQQLDNLMREEQFAAAFKLALKLKRVCLTSILEALLLNLDSLQCMQPRTMLSLVRNLLDLGQKVSMAAVLLRPDDALPSTSHPPAVGDVGLNLGRCVAGRARYLDGVC